MIDTVSPAVALFDNAEPTETPVRKRLTLVEREAQILAGAIAFFSVHGFDGQMRVLATEVGVTHALLYHYFPTKQALIDRVYFELFEGRWKPEWERLLDDPKVDVEEKFVAFYTDYAASVLTRDFVRIFMFSGLSDRYITDRFFTLLGARLFPRLIRETRRHCGAASRRKPGVREFELLMGLHGGIFYNGVRQYIYGQAGHAASLAASDAATIRDRVRSYLLSAQTILAAPQKVEASALGGITKSRRTAAKVATDNSAAPAARRRGGRLASNAPDTPDKPVKPRTLTNRKGT
ncbi:MAG: TetR/AcrR family transcriptional regulator [Herminiimonas sp.]|nr:TetR/AcrR family transcriptional regulator [Herminiimonas sp.]